MFLVINVFRILFLLFVSAEKDPFVIQLRPDQVLNTFQSVISSDYLRTLANDFAKKAAEHLLSEMKNQEKQFTVEYRSPEEKKLNKQQVLTLLREPSPDGDNLEKEMVLSDEEAMKSTKEPQKKGPMKINGAYYKRFLQ